MKDKKIFGSFIKEKRIEKGLSQKDLADILFVSDGAVSKWERGISYPDITLLTTLCKILEISEHELLESCCDEEERRLKKDAYKYNKMRKTIIWTLNISYILTLVVCFIVNLTVSHKLSWFFIVFTGIICAYTYIPTINHILLKSKKIFLIKFKDVSILLSQILSLFIIYLTCSIYTNNYWFMISTLGTLLGYFIIFYPILFIKYKKECPILNNKFLFTYSLFITIIVFILLIFIHIYNSINLLQGLLSVLFFSIIPIMLGLSKIIFNNHYTKIKLITLIALCISIVIFLSISVISSIRIYNSKEKLIYDIDDNINEIYIYSDYTNISVNYSLDNNISYTKFVDTEYIFKKIDNKLYIDQKRSTKFYINMISTTINIDININQNLTNLILNNETGNIDINKDINLNNLEISTTTGNININNIIVSNDIKIVNQTGNIKLSNITNLGNINLECNTGNVSILNITSLNITLNNTTGNINLNNIESNKISASCKTGYIKGSLSSDYTYFTNITTGNINVPNTKGEYECILTVKTGNINISLI